MHRYDPNPMWSQYLWASMCGGCNRACLEGEYVCVCVCVCMAALQMYAVCAFVLRIYVVCVICCVCVCTCVLLYCVLCEGIIGASLSEPHIDEFAVEFLYIYVLYIVCRAVSHFHLLFCAFLHHSL